MLKLTFGGKRPGSILATSISLVAVFLTMVVGSMVYVQNTMSQARSERLRTSAEEAARSGLELVLGWAEANIDQETRLPKAWDSMQDADIIDPISQIQENASAPTSIISTALTPGSIIGGTNQNEYVVGVQGQYITTFKARIQQFRLSEDMPRQYRIGVVGRVRKVQPPNRAQFNNIDQNERESITAERVIVATVGKEVTSRYAALIDIDSIKNWVPGEVVTGPVHINRGYVDQAPFKNVPALISSAGSSAGVPYRDLRSTMQLYIEGETGNVGFKAPSAPPADNVKKYPVFESQVSLTEIPGGSAEYQPMDPPDTDPPLAIKINGYNYHKNNANALPLLNSYHDKIFLAGENSMANRYGFNGGFYRGPLIVRQPIELPRSVRNSLGSAIGLPGELVGRARWEDLPNGVYVPTPAFWSTVAPAPDANNLPWSQSYAPGGTRQAPVGGIYIRGEVEAMRFGKGIGAQAHLSYYLFQVSNGIGTPDLSNERGVYIVVADRALKQLALSKLPSTYQRIHGLAGDPANRCLFRPGVAGDRTLSQLLVKAGLGGNNASGWSSSSAEPRAFSLGPIGAAGARAVFAAPLYSDFPFNGTIYVDCARFDPARRSTQNAYRSMATTGNILALGNLGAKNSPCFDKAEYAVDGQIGEMVATYRGTDPKGPASKLTIMARGNIFIQNHLLVDGVFTAYKAEAGEAANAQVGATTAIGAARAALSKIKLEHSRDVLGLVSDKQIVVGAAAPRPSDTVPPPASQKRRAGVVIMASIAGLGDPAWQPWTDGLNTNYLSNPLSFIGSFATEGLMPAYSGGNPNVREEYYITRQATPAGGGNPNLVGGSNNPPTAGDLQSSQVTADFGYPGNPIYAKEQYNTLLTLAGNPNIQGTRGRMIVFGSITQKKRGIVGQGNASYDKDFVYDKRLLTIAPPIFPASVNVQVRTQTPFSPDDSDPARALTYATGGVIKKKGDLDFLGATPAGATPQP